MISLSLLICLVLLLLLKSLVSLFLLACHPWPAVEFTSCERGKPEISERRGEGRWDIFCRVYSFFQKTWGMPGQIDDALSAPCLSLSTITIFHRSNDKWNLLFHEKITITYVQSQSQSTLLSFLLRPTSFKFHFDVSWTILVIGNYIVRRKKFKISVSRYSPLTKVDLNCKPVPTNLQCCL